MPVLATKLAVILNEYLPLKQGLRLSFAPISVISIILNEYLPLKQGLRPSLPNVKTSRALLNEYLPLKQGLRLGLRCTVCCAIVPSMSIFH